MLFIKKLIYRLRGEVTTEELIANGMKVGINFSRQNNVILDPGHCWLIQIGNNVTIAPRVIVLCHDASTKQSLGYAKVGCVTIGNNVFIGAGSILLPGTRIGNDVIIGANSTLTGEIPDGVVALGSPARVIGSTQEYLLRMKEVMCNSPCYGEEYTVRGNISPEKKKKMFSELSKLKYGFIK